LKLPLNWIYTRITNSHNPSCGRKVLKLYKIGTIVCHCKTWGGFQTHHEGSAWRSPETQGYCCHMQGVILLNQRLDSVFLSFDVLPCPTVRLVQNSHLCVVTPWHQVNLGSNCPLNTLNHKPHLSWPLPLCMGETPCIASLASLPLDLINSWLDLNFAGHQVILLSATAACNLKPSLQNDENSK
jgi:hypothetical protein